jgi:hypothetical protein
VADPILKHWFVDSIGHKRELYGAANSTILSDFPLPGRMRSLPSPVEGPVRNKLTEMSSLQMICTWKTELTNSLDWRGKGRKSRTPGLSTDVLHENELVRFAPTVELNKGVDSTSDDRSFRLLAGEGSTENSLSFGLSRQVCVCARVLPHPGRWDCHYSFEASSRNRCVLG